ncbi:polymeric immunoglobulin receptor-like, partial [Antrostomus carolinensis]|uniref:polymeric immunoglobulin receptor-like n=1 Tax=Antrostomus carolinensis TaxID=279965 RepID=UPI0010A98E8E
LHAQTAKEEEESLPEGSTLSIQCPYTAHADQEWKVWCRVRDGKCDPLVETAYQTQYPQRNKATKGKITIEDDPTNRTMTITMTNLQIEDSDTYACGYGSYSVYLPLKVISLTVFKELHKRELERLSVQCKYSALVARTDIKGWCRRDKTSCKTLVRTDQTSTWRSSKALEDRALIQDDTQNRIFTITMEKLQTQDSGTYWCALYSYSNVIQIMEVRLSVSK